MTGFLGQKFDFTGKDGGWYSVIADANLHINMRVTSPVADLPEITCITGTCNIWVEQRFKSIVGGRWVPRVHRVLRGLLLSCAHSTSPFHRGAASYGYRSGQRRLKISCKVVGA